MSFILLYLVKGLECKAFYQGDGEGHAEVTSDDLIVRPTLKRSFMRKLSGLDINGYHHIELIRSPYTPAGFIGVLN